MAAGDEGELPLKPIPGSYGIPFFTPIRDRLDFYYSKPPHGFFLSRMNKYRSTVFRANAPPGPFMARDPRVIVLLDAKSFPILFDNSKVDKTDVLTGTYVPSTALTGGYRVCAYLDASEPTHAKVKELVLSVLVAKRKSAFIPTFVSAYSSLFDSLEAQLAASGKAEFNGLNEATAFEFFCRAFFGASPAGTPLGSSGHTKAIKWLLLQLHPIMTLGLPKILEELFLHSFPLPPLLVRSDYKALYDYFSSAGAAVLDEAEKLGLSRDEACHNLLFITIFNAYGGVKLLFPSILRWVVSSGPALQARLAGEVRAAVEAEGGFITAGALERMELVKSVVYEVLRMDPPVQYQYARAKEDLVVESHEARYAVKKGEMLFGYQPLATRDERVFERGGEFVAERFVGEEGRRLLRYVVWSNGPETEAAAVGNKQCPGKEVVVLVGRLLLAVTFLRFDTLTAEVQTSQLEPKITVTALTKPTPSPRD